VVLAGTDDYLRLVMAHGASLPTVSLDPNPYWMGFYSTRPQLKQRVRRLGRALLQAEHRLTIAHPAVDGPPGAFAALRQGWDGMVISNHHDFVTGTASDRVFRAEQSDMLTEAEEHASVATSHARGDSGVFDLREGALPRFKREGELVEVETPWYRVQLDGRLGGCITGWWLPGREESLVAGASNDVVAYRDSGGLWRMGHEFNGGTFREVDSASKRPAEIQVEEIAGALKVVIEATVGGRPVKRDLWLRSDTPIVRMRVHGAAARRRTVTCRFATRLRPTELAMDVPGGVVRRELVRIYDPTFWCASNFVHALDAGSGEGLALIAGGPVSVSAGPTGTLEWVMLRNTPRERAFGFLPVPAHPASGANDERHGFDYAVWFTPGGDWRENRLHAGAEHLLWAEPGSHGLAERAVREGTVHTDNPDVRVRAVKPADDGRGVVVRLVSYSREAATVRLTLGHHAITQAVLCDALERDLREVGAEDGSALVPVGPGAIVTARVLLAKPSAVPATVG
jgi:hypothetical protein